MNNIDIIIRIVILGFIIMLLFAIGNIIFKIFRKRIRIRKKVRKHKKYLWKRINIPFPDYIKSREDTQDRVMGMLFSPRRLMKVKEDYIYCDFCGKKIIEGTEHDTQKCLIKKYNHVVIK